MAVTSHDRDVPYEWRLYEEAIECSTPNCFLIYRGDICLRDPLRRVDALLGEVEGGLIMFNEDAVHVGLVGMFAIAH